MAGDRVNEPEPPPTPGRRHHFPARFPAALRLLVVVSALGVTGYIAANGNRVTVDPAFETTEDAVVSGDVTSLVAKVSGYVTAVPVRDFQAIKKGELIAEIDPSDYNAILAQAEANVSAAKAILENLAYQRAVQRSLVRQAEATIDATNADLDRNNLEATRQKNLLKSGVTGTPQDVELADANAKRAAAQLEINKAQLAQQKAILASLDVEQLRLEAQVRAAEAQATIAQNNVDHTRIVSPADGALGQRLVRPGQLVSPGTHIVDVVSLSHLWITANFKKGQIKKIRPGQHAAIRFMEFPDLKLSGHVDSWLPRPGLWPARVPTGNEPENAANDSWRVAVKVELDDVSGIGTEIRPGMPVEVAVDTGSTPPKSQNSPASTPSPTSSQPGE